VIRSHFIEYVRPAFAGDKLMVATWVAGVDKQTSPRKYRFVRVRDGKTVVEAETLWVYCDATTGRPIDITPEISDSFPVVTDAAEIQSAVDDGLSSSR
jgi:acyl-CoA thioester hydrolase